MPQREKIVFVSLEDHNKQYYEKQKERELHLRNGCTCSYWELESKNLKTLMKFYSHHPTCPKYVKKD